jgi:2,3-dihydroxy-p-cumate/2,3-dihydroxybenzoate 3,4-dioxygenase
MSTSQTLNPTPTSVPVGGHMTPAFRHKKLGYVALNVTDLDRSADFYESVLGLDLTARKHDTAYLRCGSDHHNVILNRSSKPGLKRVAFELEAPADVAKAFDHFKQLGLSPIWVDRAELHQAQTFRVREPATDLVFEYYVGMEQMAAPFKGELTKIARLGHVVIHTDSYQNAVRRLTQDFGFCVSDEIPGFIAFMRCFPNPFHHSFAVVQSDRKGLHHVNFMVTDIDDVGKAIYRLRKVGVQIVFGPGRHEPSESVFLYFLEPDGMTLEYSFGMEEFPEVSPRQPRTMKPAPETLDRWGSVPAPSFGKVGEIETV